MTTIIIEDVDDALIHDLSRMAAENGLPMEVQAKHILRRAVPVDDRAALVARLKAIAAMTPKDVVQTDSVEMLREDRQR